MKRMIKEASALKVEQINKGPSKMGEEEIKKETRNAELINRVKEEQKKQDERK